MKGYIKTNFIYVSKYLTEMKHPSTNWEHLI